MPSSCSSASQKLRAVIMIMITYTNSDISKFKSNSISTFLPSYVASLSVGLRERSWDVASGLQGLGVHDLWILS